MKGFKNIKKIFLIIVFFNYGLWTTDYGLAFAADKNWIGAGDGISWSDKKNWFSEGVPTSADNATVDLKDAQATCDKTFEAKSVTVGGASASTLTTNNFIYGTISPTSSSDNALYIRKDGTVNLKGAGTITLKGKFKNSEEALVGEESFMFTLE